MEDKIRKVIASHNFICNKEECNDADSCSVSEDIVRVLKECGCKEESCKECHNNGFHGAIC